MEQPEWPCFRPEGVRHRTSPEEKPACRGCPRARTAGPAPEARQSLMPCTPRPAWAQPRALGVAPLGRRGSRAAGQLGGREASPSHALKPSNTGQGCCRVVFQGWRACGHPGRSAIARQQRATCHTCFALGRVVKRELSCPAWPSHAGVLRPSLQCSRPKSLCIHHQNSACMEVCIERPAAP